MKKLLLLLFVTVILHGFTQAQTPYWNETFDSGQGWSLDENWQIADGKLRFYWSPTITNFDLSATSSTISLMENTQELIVTQYLDAYASGSPPEKAEVILIHNGEEDVLWYHELSSGNWGQSNGSELICDISSYGGENVQIKFRTHGPSTFNWNWWDVFEVKITTLLENDLTITDISGPTVLEEDETGTWELTVRNIGSQPQTGFTLDLLSFKFGEMIGNALVEDVINPQEDLVYEFSWTPDTAQNTALSGKVSLDGDEFEGNNHSASHFVRVKPDLDIDILVWDNDNAIQTITDPEHGDLIEPSTALIRTLDAAGLEYDYVWSLPDDLFSYDIVFATMGCYCVS